MDNRKEFYPVNEESEKNEFSIFFKGDVPWHKETVKFYVEKDGKFNFNGTCSRACQIAIFTMRNHYKEVLKEYEEGKQYCDEVTVSYEIGDEEMEKLGDFVKILKHERCTMSFDYLTQLDPEKSGK